MRRVATRNTLTYSRYCYPRRLAKAADDMPGKVLPDKLIEQWMRSGKTDAEIVRLLVAQENISVTRQAISAWRKRKGMGMKAQPPRAMPWDLRPEHRAMEPARTIRNFARVQRGETLPAEEQQRLDRALAYLDSVGGVYHYDPSFEEGWFVVPRRPGVDDAGIVRVP